MLERVEERRRHESASLIDTGTEFLPEAEVLLKRYEQGERRLFLLRPDG